MPHIDSRSQTLRIYFSICPAADVNVNLISVQCDGNQSRTCGGPRSYDFPDVKWCRYRQVLVSNWKNKGIYWLMIIIFFIFIVVWNFFTNTLLIFTSLCETVVKCNNIQGILWGVMWVYWLNMNSSNILFEKEFYTAKSNDSFAMVPVNSKYIKSTKKLNYFTVPLLYCWYAVEYSWGKLSFKIQTFCTHFHTRLRNYFN